MVNMMLAVNNTDLTAEHWQTSYTDSELAAAAQSIAYILADYSIYLNLTDWPLAEYYKSSDGDDWSQLVEPWYSMLDQPDVILTPNRTHGLVVGTLLITYNGTQDVVSARDLYYLALPSFADYEPSRYLEDNITVYVEEDQYSAPLTLVPYDDIVADLAVDTVAMSQYLSSVPNMDQDQVDSAITLYESLIQQIPQGYVFVEPHPWPMTDDDIKGMLYSGSDALPESIGSLVPRNEDLTFLPEESFVGTKRYRLWSINYKSVACHEIMMKSWSTNQQSEFRVAVSSENCLYDPINITYEVLDTNDAPVVTSEADMFLASTSTALATYFLPHTPFNTSDNEGFMVGHLANAFTDYDGTHPLGVAILGAQNTSGIGEWQYKVPGGSWTTLELSQSYPPALTKEVSLNTYSYIRECQNNPFSDACLDSLDFAQLAARGLTGSLYAYLLKPDVRIRYQPETDATFWTWQEAKSSVKLAWTGWDMSNDNSTDDVIEMEISQLFCLPDIYTGYSQYTCPERGEAASLCDVTLVAEMHREGCDGSPSSMMETDDCGVCGGSNDCYDCNGVPFGTAVIDLCGACTEGDTGLTYDYLRDCAGVCNGKMQNVSISDSPSIYACIAGSAADYISQFFCDGVWDSGAWINSCGNCVSGTTGLADTEGMDACNICGGSGDTCLDCAGVPLGPNELDYCDNCADPASASWNFGCLTLAEVQDNIIWYAVPVTVHIDGSSLWNFDTIDMIYATSTIHDGIEFPLLNIGMGVNSTYIYGDIPDFSTSNAENADYESFELVATFTGFDGVQQSLTVESALILFVPLDVAFITPSEITRGYTGEAVITGNSNDQLTVWPDLVVFIDCSYNEADMVYIPACMSFSTYTKVGSRRIVFLPITSVTETDITVDLTYAGQVTKGMSLSIKANVEPPTYEAEITRAIVVPLIVNSQQPSTTGAEFSSDLCSMSISFDMNVGVEDTTMCTYAERSTCCDYIFSATSAATLGTGSSCWLIGSTLQVFFGVGSTVSAGTVLSFTSDVIKEQGTDAAYAIYLTSTVTVAALSQDPLPTISKDSAPSVVSGCAIFQMKVSVGGSVGCLNTPELYWDIELADSADVLGASNQALMTDLQTYLQEVSKTNIEIDGTQIPNGYTFNITVFAINYMGFTSEVVTHQVTKEATESPIQVTLTTEDIVNPGDVVNVKTDVIETPCSTIDIAQKSYQYSVDSVDFDMSSFMMSSAKLDGSVLNIRGGKTYTITVKVTVLTTQSEALTYEQSSSFSVNMVNPVASLKAPSKVGTQDALKLDGAQSYDPNKYLAGMNYIWTCHNYTAEDLGYDAACRVWSSGSFILLQSTLPNDATADIAGGLMPSGDYEMCLQVVVGTMSSTDCVDITVRPTSPPLVTLPKTVDEQSPLENLKIEGTVCYAARAMIEWVAVIETGYSSLTMTTDCLTDSSTVKEAWMDCKTVSLVCSGLQASSSYKFQLTANEVDADGNIVVADTSDGDEPDTYASSDVVVTTLSSPTISSVSVSPLSGQAFDTVFKIYVDASDPQGAVISYQYFFEDNDGSVQELSGKDGISMQEQKMGAGDGLILVVATNAYGMTASAYSDAISVEAFDESSVSSDDLSNMIQGQSSGGLQMAVMLFTSISDSTLLAAVSAVAESSSRNELTAVSGADTATSLERIDTCVMTLTTVCVGAGCTVSSDTSIAIMTALKTLASVFGAGSSVSSKRRRRDVSSVTAMTESEAESMLNLAAVNFVGVDDADIVQQDSIDFFDTLENSVLIGLCQDRVVGEPATEVFTNIGVVRIERHDFDPIASEVINLACDDCSATTLFNYSATVVMGSYMESTYAQWECDTGETCEGACIASSQIPRDILTASSTLVAPLLTTLRSDIVGLAMINPETAGYITPNLTESGNTVQISLPVVGDVDLASYSLECRQWVASDWTASTCTSNNPVLSGGIHYVFCDCTEFTYTAIFEGEPSSDSIDLLDGSDSSAGLDLNLTHTICDEDTDRVWVEFDFIADYDTIAVDPPRFLAALQAHLADMLLIQEDQIIDLEASSDWIYSDIHPWFDQAAILVSFEIHALSRLKRTLYTSLTVAQAVTYLKQLVVGDTLDFIPPVGIPISTDADSFHWLVIVDPPTDYTPIIIGVVVPLLIILIIVVVCCCWWFVCGRRKKQQKKVGDSQEIRDRIAMEIALEAAAEQRYAAKTSVVTHHGAAVAKMSSREGTIVHVQAREKTDLGPIDGLMQTSDVAYAVPVARISSGKLRRITPSPQLAPTSDLYTEKEMEPAPFLAVVPSVQAEEPLAEVTVISHSPMPAVGSDDTPGAIVDIVPAADEPRTFVVEKSETDSVRGYSAQETVSVEPVPVHLSAPVTKKKKKKKVRAPPVLPPVNVRENQVSPEGRAIPYPEPGTRPIVSVAVPMETAAAAPSLPEPGARPIVSVAIPMETEAAAAVAPSIDLPDAVETDETIEKDTDNRKLPKLFNLTTTAMAATAATAAIRTKYIAPLPKKKKRVVPEWVMPEPRKIPGPWVYEPPNSDAVMREYLKQPTEKKKTQEISKKYKQAQDAEAVKAKMAPLLSVYSLPAVARPKPKISKVVDALVPSKTKNPSIPQEKQEKQEKKLLSILNNIRQKTVTLNKSSVPRSSANATLAVANGGPRDRTFSKAPELPQTPDTLYSEDASTAISLDNTREHTPTTPFTPAGTSYGVTPRVDDDVILSVRASVATSYEPGVEPENNCTDA